MIDLDVTFFVQLINFLVTLVILNMLLIKPIREQIKKRADIMSSLLSEVEKISDDAKSKMQSYKAALIDANAKATSERQRFKDESAQEDRLLIEYAVKEAQTHLIGVRKTTAVQVNVAMDSLKDQIGEFAQKVVDKVLS
ncbi:F-type H+-transporting ATPase subunit b [Desulfovibrionales bacterium]